MRIDVVTIFPEYLAPLRLSLPGKAQDAGLLDIRVHDLRDWTHDRHRTVDDTPYGGGAGMVMRPEPWGEALDALADEGTTLVVPTPSGLPFGQRTAAELAERSHLLFAAGRYEGIDERVMEHARGRIEVRELSVGDYVLNGGEAATLVMVEAVVRLLPGFMGNPESLAEESHGGSGLLEYPVYTKPAAWRGLDVPDVLLSGDHARIAAWRHDQAARRTAQRRPDLLPTSALLDDVQVRAARPADAGELFTLQRACWVQEAQTEHLDELRRWVREDRTLVAHADGRLVGAVRARLRGSAWDVGRLMVAPDLQGRGLGRLLLERIEAEAPAAATTYQLFTGAGSRRNQRMYKKAGYRMAGEVEPGVVRMTKRR
ncbi:MAG: tRNA (guanosine(37)-N1)-methyltransferase TrmD [Nocardioidaceae bacterium]|nr:tRNA (guanosine(37)-N1)-methyltransferase TrmD [Nocardioidaceae bacterium]